MDRDTRTPGSDQTTGAGTPGDQDRAALAGLVDRLPPVTPVERAEPVPPPLQATPASAPREEAPRVDTPRAGARPAAAAPPRAAAPHAAVEALDRPVADVPEGPVRVRGLALPQRVARISNGRKIWFGISFVAPVLIGALYLFAITPDEYTTEFRFSVRVPVGQPGTMADGGATMSALFGGNPTPGTDLLDNFTVADYARSQQAAVDLDHKLDLRSIYNKPSDPFSRVGDKATNQRLGRFWRSMVYSDFDVTTGLAVVRVKAYTAQDSYRIANQLLDQATVLVNQIGDQSQSDTVLYARRQVARAQQSVNDLRRQLRALSAQKGIDSPSLGVISADSGMSTTARSNVAAIQGQITALMSQLHNPNAPQIRMLREQLAANMRILNGAVDAANTPGTNRYVDLTSQLSTALTVLSNAQASLGQSLAAQEAQRLYLTTYVKPQLADAPNAPDRWVDLLLITAVAAMVWMIGMLIRNSVMEHGV